MRTIPKAGPILVAPTPTPFDSNDRVDHGALARNMRRWLNTPLCGFVLGSGIGEEQTLTECEKVDIVRTVDAVLGQERFIIAGIDAPSVEARTGSVAKAATAIP